MHTFTAFTTLVDLPVRALLWRVGEGVKRFPVWVIRTAHVFRRGALARPSKAQPVRVR